MKFVVDEVALLQEFDLNKNVVLLQAKKQSEIYVPSKNAFENLRTSARERVMHCFSQHHPDILFNYLRT